MREHLKATIIKFIKENVQSCKESVLSLIDFEMAYMNTLDLNFNNDETTSSDEEIPTTKQLHKEVQDIYRKLEIYLAHVKNNMKDMVPKAITCCIVKKLVKYITYDVMHHSTVIKPDEYVSVAYFNVPL